MKISENISALSLNAAKYLSCPKQETTFSDIAIGIAEQTNTANLTLEINNKISDIIDILMLHKIKATSISFEMYAYNINRPNLDWLFVDNDIVIYATYEEEYKSASIKIYSYEDVNETHDYIHPWIQSLYNHIYTNITAPYPFGIIGQDYISLRWIPKDFKEEDFDIDSTRNALLEGVPYKDVFADLDTSFLFL